jgi:hypothetical protein
VTIQLENFNNYLNCFLSMDENIIEKMQMLFCITFTKTIYLFCLCFGMDSQVILVEFLSTIFGFSSCLISYLLAYLSLLMQSLTNNLTKKLYPPIQFYIFKAKIKNSTMIKHFLTIYVQDL